MYICICKMWEKIIQLNYSILCKKKIQFCYRNTFFVSPKFSPYVSI